MLSTTRSSAVWLLSTDTFGLESTRTFPNDDEARFGVDDHRCRFAEADVGRGRRRGSAPGRARRRLNEARLGGAGGQDLVGLVQDVFDVLFQRCPELVVGSIADRGAGAV